MFHRVIAQRANRLLGHPSCLLQSSLVQGAVILRACCGHPSARRGLTLCKWTIIETPISYYGGKQQLARKILSLIPEHKTYVEPFVGGGAIFFAKQPSPCEVINDTNCELINFYEMLKTDFDALSKLDELSLHSRKQHDEAEVVFKNPQMFDRVKKAWAVDAVITRNILCMYS
ncbi:MAG: DNA adenine methylase [Treponemataceae bacterium]